MEDSNLYSVSRTRTITEYIDIEAASKEAAIELAKISDDSDWINPESSDYDYDAVSV